MPNVQTDAPLTRFLTTTQSGPHPASKTERKGMKGKPSKLRIGGWGDSPYNGEGKGGGGGKGEPARVGVGGVGAGRCGGGGRGGKVRRWS